MEIIEAKPPFVQFEKRSVEDRQATIEAGHYVGRDIDFALITPSGSHDCVEKHAEDWIRHIERESRDGRFPGPWVDYYKRAYAQWKDGQEIPLEGTPLANWPGLAPSMLKTLNSINIRTVEDLANANEEAIHRMGMGGRALKARAQAFLNTSEDVGKVAEEVAALRLENAKLKAANEDFIKRFQALENAKPVKASPAKADSNDLDDILKES